LSFREWHRALIALGAWAVLFCGTARAQEPPTSQPTSLPSASVLVGYTLEGEVQEDESELRRVLDNWLVVKEPLLPETEAKALEFLRSSLHYGVTASRSERGEQLILRLALRRLTRVRRVDIDGTLWPIFADEIKRRMQLIPGQTLAEDATLLANQLDDERDRIKHYLARQGYFSPSVKVWTEPAGDPKEVVVRVTVQRGPGYAIGKITITGNAAIRDEEIRSKFHHTCLGRYLADFSVLEGISDSPILGWPLKRIRKSLSNMSCVSKDRLDADVEAVRKYYRAHNFPAVRVSANFNEQNPERLDARRHTIGFTLKVVENREIDVVTMGNSALSEAEIKRVVTFNADGAYDDYAIAASELAIRRRYQQSGYYQTLVTHERVRLLPNFERIVFYLHEGPKLTVQDLQFEGNRFFTDKQLKSRITTKVYGGRLSWRGGYLTQTQLRQDVEAIRAAYAGAGFPETRVAPVIATERELVETLGASAALIAAEAGSGLYIRYRIKEGPRRTVGTVSFLKNRVANDSDLVEATALRPGDPFTQDALDRDAELIKQAYAKIGYPYVTVTSTHKARSGGEVNVTHTIEEKKPATFGVVLVRGNFKTEDWVIRDVLGFRDGELMTTEQIEQGLTALQQTGLFSSVQITPIGHESEREVVHYAVEVREQHDNLLSAEVRSGYSTDNKAFLGLSLSFLNLGGWGPGLTVDGEYGLEIKRASATVTVPLWVLRARALRRMRLDTKLFWRREDTERFGELEQYGTSAEVSHELHDPERRRRSLRISLLYNLRKTVRTVELVRGAGDNQDLTEDRPSTLTSSLGLSMIYDRRKNKAEKLDPITPTQGIKLAAQVSIASQHLLSSDDFIKLHFSEQWLVPLGERFRLTQGLRYDHGIPYGEESILPEVERYFAGGDTTVRGFEADRLHTEIIRNRMSGIETFRVVPAGGNIRLLHNIDLQLTITTVAGLPLTSAIFSDQGMILNSGPSSVDELRSLPIRWSLGIAAARLVLPIGALSVEYAIPMNPRLGDDPTGRLHVNLGLVF
jgi:outer membrane protein insertion porin family